MVGTTKSPMEDDVQIGLRIRTRRMAVGLSQEKLGEMVGITFQQIQKYEKGTNRVGGSRMAAIAKALQTPVAYFFDETNGAASIGGFSLVTIEIARMIEPMDGDLKKAVRQIVRVIRDTAGTTDHRQAA